MPSARRWWLLLGLLLLAGSYKPVDAEEGDDCKLPMNLPGICRGSSACDTIEGYLRSGKLSASQVPSCGLGLIEENICCPIAPCCSTDQGQLPAPLPSPSPSPSKAPVSTTSERSRDRDREPASQPSREREPRLDENLDFFDFIKLLSTTTLKPQKTHESMKMPTQNVGFQRHPSGQRPTAPAGNADRACPGGTDAHETDHNNSISTRASDNEQSL
ncbi:serine protease Hayan-like isoform X2 [Drosophila serrata]|uniref:serine protease Hayan-like isoform X2 n=1 Tax=Drosophila serrata TaxID=7274 RepID=UPI000A1D1D75|nr:serine protease Hayan-like isoform X2 [Drosophila serrata]